MPPTTESAPAKQSSAPERSLTQRMEALLARASGDVPICALMLLLAALSTAFLSLSPADSEKQPLRAAGETA